MTANVLERNRLTGPRVLDVMKVRKGADGWRSGYVSLDRALRYLQMKKANSEETKKQVSSVLSYFCRFTKLNPDQLVQLDKDTLERMVNEYAEEVWNKPGNRWGKTVNTYVTLLKVFFRENGFRRENGKELVVRKFRVPPRTLKRGEYIPDPVEAIRMANTCGEGTRDYAMIMMAAFSGLRISDLRAIRYGQFKDELESGQDCLLVRITVDLKKYVSGACKGEIAYFTFTSRKTTDALRSYLKERIRNFGSIDDEAPLFSSTWTGILDSGKREMKEVSDQEFRVVVRNAARRGGLVKWDLVTPHKLRKTFFSLLVNQPLESRLDPKDQLFLEGHMQRGAEDPYYDKSNVEGLRAKFAKLVVERDPEYRTVREMARSVGVDPDAARIELASRLEKEPSLAEEIENLRQFIKSKVHGYETHRKETRIVDEDELRRLLQSGDVWEVGQVLNSGKIVISRMIDGSEGGHERPGRPQVVRVKKPSNTAHDGSQTRTPITRKRLSPLEVSIAAEALGLRKTGMQVFRVCDFGKFCGRDHSTPCFHPSVRNCLSHLVRKQIFIRDMKGIYRVNSNLALDSIELKLERSRLMNHTSNLTGESTAASQDWLAKSSGVGVVHQQTGSSGGGSPSPGTGPASPSLDSWF